MMREMKEYGLREPEFVDMGIALRINLYRAAYMTPLGPQRVLEHMGEYQGAPESAGECRRVPESAGENRICIEKLPEQQMIIYQAIAEKGEITTAGAALLLQKKQRRTRAILKEMTEKGVIRKVGAAQNTKYILA